MLKPERIWYLSCQAHRKGLRPVARMLKALNYALYKCLLPCEADIQPDIRLKHLALGVVIHPQVTIGKNCLIHHAVNIAAESAVGSKHRVTIGNNVVIGVGAILIGNEHGGIYIGDGARIGAGAVVTQSVPAGQTIVASPARPVRMESSAPKAHAEPKAPVKLTVE